MTGDKLDEPVGQLLNAHLLDFDIVMPLIQDAVSKLRSHSYDVHSLNVLNEVAQCSIAGSSALALNGIGPLILQVLNHGMQVEQGYLEQILRLATSLAENCPCSDVLEAEQWLQPLLFLMADNIVQHNIACLQSILLTFNAVVRTRQRKVMQTIKRKPIIWHLLKNLASYDDAHIQALAASLLCSLTEDGLQLPKEEESFWRDQLLHWVINGDKFLSDKAAAALASFRMQEWDMRSRWGSFDSSVESTESIHLAKKWLSQALMVLSTSSYLDPRHPNSAELSEPWVVPSYIRYVADEILDELPHTEPPEYFDVHKIDQLTLDWEEDESDETPLSRGLAILCDFGADNDQLCAWLMKVDVLAPCKFLMSRKDQPIREQQQIARLLALLSRNNYVGEKFTDWLSWLRRSVESPDLSLASNALRALVHIQLGQLNSPGSAISFPDGIHFFEPCADIAETVVLNQKIEDNTDVDVVFVHGIRGGPYLTWRIDGTLNASHVRELCWPSNWLCSDIPQTRLLSINFAAPFSSWEGGSISLQVTASNLLKKLKECGIGSRPLVFIAHSMGGLVVKELLVRALESSSLSEISSNTRGVVFISTPHHGVWLAHLAWGLRHIGACPAPSLNDMKPGPYLEELNSKIQALVAEAGIRVLNFAETLSTDVSPMMPRIHVVTSASAYPGFGETVSLEGLDHISSCKPKSKTDLFYQHTCEFLDHIVEGLK